MPGSRDPNTLQQPVATGARVAAALQRGRLLCQRLLAFLSRDVQNRTDNSAASLIHHIVSIQLAISAAVGVAALGGLYWTSQTIIETNLDRWASQWTSQLNELGAPLYVTEPASVLLDIERFVDAYPEVAQVAWFDVAGSLLYSIDQTDGADVTTAAPLDPAVLARLQQDAARGEPQILDEYRNSGGRYSLVGPIWSESITGDGLISLEAKSPPETEIEVMGYVAVHLDYSWHRIQLAQRLLLGSVALLIILALSSVVGRRLLKRALQPLANLQQPLADLAKGNMQVKFKSSRFHEIQNIIRTLAGTTAALAQRDSRLSHLATHDSLTGLLNRHAFVQELAEEMERLRKSEEQSAVLFIDLDQFKYINDTCGHTAGDELLRMAARSIKSTLRAEDHVARLGGDEFTVLARGVTRQQARDVAEKIVRQMGMLTQVHENHVFHLQCSIGVAIVTPSELGADEFLSRADMACHAAKEKGRNRIEMYRVSTHEGKQMSREIGWIQRVKSALESDAFALVYQPLLRLRTGWTDHYEVLLRLETETGELIPPDAFLPAATRFGLMVDIDHWVLEKSIAALAGFRKTRDEINLSINLSAAVFEDDKFARRVESLLNAHAVPAESIIFEITEQTAVRFAVESDKQITLLRKIGCRFAIDDFGKGYSSFSYLKQLPVDYLKIDGSFIENLEGDAMNQTLVRALGDIARSAGLETIAECVETAAALSLLADLGIDYAQGYHIARPSRAPEEVDIEVVGSIDSTQDPSKRAGNA